MVKFEESMSVTTTTWGVMSSWFTPMMFFVLVNFMIVAIFVSSGSGKRKKMPQLCRTPSMLRRLKSINFYQFGSFNRSRVASVDQAQMDSREIVSEMEEEEAEYTMMSDEDDTIHSATDEEDSDKGRDDRNTSDSEPAPVEPVKRKKKKSASSRSAFRHFRESEIMEEEVVVVDHPMMSEELETHPSTTDEEGDEADDRFDKGEINMSMNEVYSQLQRQGSHNRTKSDTEPASGAVPVKLVKKMKKSASSKSAFKHFREVEILEARRPATVKEAKVKRAADEEEVDSKADDFINMFKQHLKLQRLDSILRYKEMLDRGASK